MIQPAAHSLLTPAPVRATPSPVGSGAVFALPVESGDLTALLVGVGDGGRQDDAAPGNTLPIDPVAPAPWPPLASMPDAIDRPGTPATDGKAPSRGGEGEFTPALPKPTRARSNAAMTDDPTGTDMPAATSSSAIDPSVAEPTPCTVRLPPAPIAAPTLPPAPSPVPHVPATDDVPSAGKTAALPAYASSATPRASARGEAPPPTDAAVPRSPPPAAISRGSAMAPLAGKNAPPLPGAARSVAISDVPIDEPAVTVADAIVPPASDVRAAVSRAASEELPSTTRSGEARAEMTSPLKYDASGTPKVTQTSAPARSPMPRTVPDPVSVLAGATPRPANSPVVTGSAPSWRTPMPGTSVVAATPPTALPSHWQRAVPITSLTPDLNSVMPVTAFSASMSADPSAATPLPAATAEMPVAPTPSPDRPAAAVPPAPPSAPPLVPVQAAPAALVFGAARFAAQLADDRDDRVPAPGLAPLAAPTAIDRAAAIPATAHAHAPLDMTREHWPASMIERIEMIRDAVNEVDTRIRLIPDALGAIDVAVKAEGDTLHVRFQADQPQTRALLAEAAPRLAEAAEARGLRLGQTSVGGDSYPGGQPGHQQRPSLPVAPPRAPHSPVADESAADDDTRLA